MFSAIFFPVVNIKIYALKRMLDISKDGKNKFLRHYDYTFDIKNFFLIDEMRHLSDNLILARMEAEQEEGKDALLGLDEDHLVQTLTDIFFGMHR
jgi:hypothetical protein